MRHESQRSQVIQPRKRKVRDDQSVEPSQRQRRRGKDQEREPRQRSTSTITSPAREGSRRARHTTDPLVPCLGRSFLVDKVRKGRRVRRATATAPSGGRLWHGCAVRDAAPRRGREGLDLRSPGEDLGSHPVQSALPPDKECMRARAPGPAFFTERTLAAYLAVSDRTIRNWIRRGELPSYKLGASRRIDPADVEDFLARHRDAAA
jgi:excisionase family DNA binding protein